MVPFKYWADTEGSHLDPHQMTLLLWNHRSSARNLAPKPVIPAECQLLSSIWYWHSGSLTTNMRYEVQMGTFPVPGYVLPLCIPSELCVSCREPGDVLFGPDETKMPCVVMAHVELRSWPCVRADLLLLYIYSVLSPVEGAKSTALCTVWQRKGGI